MEEDIAIILLRMKEDIAITYSPNFLYECL